MVFGYEAPIAAVCRVVAIVALHPVVVHLEGVLSRKFAIDVVVDASSFYFVALKYGARPLEETLDISSTLIVRIDLRLKADEATALLTAGGLRTHAQRPQLRAPNPSQFPVQKEAILPGFKSAPAT